MTYERMFAKLKSEKRGAFIPFLVVGDPDLEKSYMAIRALALAGADALELGIPFSDPVADGPVIQEATVRALKAGANRDNCFDVIRRIKDEFDIPVGILTYCNAVVAMGYDAFFQSAKQAGIDSVLVADMPVAESDAYVAAARATGVDTVFIAPPNADVAALKRIGSLSTGYTYVVTRKGVTGADDSQFYQLDKMVAALDSAGAPPGVAGFGISTPEHVRDVLGAGLDGAISGSATVKLLMEHIDDESAVVEALTDFVKRMKAATRRP